MYILPVLGSGADADNGMAHLITFIHTYYVTCHCHCISTFGPAPPAEYVTTAGDAGKLQRTQTNGTLFAALFT
jgi:hypothetical protein